MCIIAVDRWQISIQRMSLYDNFKILTMMVFLTVTALQNNPKAVAYFPPFKI